MKSFLTLSILLFFSDGLFAQSPSCCPTTIVAPSTNCSGIVLGQNFTAVGLMSYSAPVVGCTPPPPCTVLEPYSVVFDSKISQSGSYNANEFQESEVFIRIVEGYVKERIASRFGTDMLFTTVEVTAGKTTTKFEALRVSNSSVGSANNFSVFADVEITCNPNGSFSFLLKSDTYKFTSQDQQAFQLLRVEIEDVLKQ